MRRGLSAPHIGQTSDCLQPVQRTKEATNDDDSFFNYIERFNNFNEKHKKAIIKNDSFSKYIFLQFKFYSLKKTKKI